ncbi:ubiquitin carboxyl-terminal hydrolase [Ascosphaera apis ARSEF 7405]|uniref:ubiquitinyl hydrolase 1 n=1 Tax=Ascosphaera apis ARSEF 7405 TaxID=392613 RepID=A0A167WDF0_9EURO|nr:ubiquitin carboxyl-terminal hydrolase [Ascosphaera apis ARSEF 7405]
MESLSNKSSMTYFKTESIKCEDKLIDCLNRFEKNMIELSQRLSLQNQEVAENSVDAALNQPELYLPIQLITEDSFRAYHGFDVTSTDVRQTDSLLPKPTVALRTKKIGEVAAEAARQLGVKSGHVRLWAMISRQNKTIRPEEPLDEPEMTIEEAYAKFTNQDSAFQLYAEIRDSEAMDIAGWNTSALVFLKCFDVAKQTLTGVCHTYVHMQSRIADLGRTISEKMNWPVGSEVLLFEEVKHNLVQPMKPKQTFGDAEIQNGDIICFQRQLPEEELASLPCTDARQYYTYLFNQRDIRFIPLKSGKIFTLTLNGKMSYEQWSTRVGKHLKIDPTRLRFAPISQQSGQPKSYVKRSTSRNLSYVLRGTSSFFEHDNRREDRLFYEILEESLSEYETKKLLKISWLPDGIVNEQPMDLLVPDDGIVKDVIDALRKRLGVPKDRDIRMIEVYDDKIYRSLAETIEIRKIGEKSLLYAEPTPLEELNMKSDEFIIHAFNFDKDIKRTHGVPFRFVLKAGEKVIDMKERLCDRMNLRDETFDKIKISVVPDEAAVPIYMDDEDVLYEFVIRFNGCMLGLDYMENFSIIL